MSGLQASVPHDAGLAAKFFTTLFKGWRRNEVDFVVLRNHAGLPANPGNDVDILIGAECLQLAERVLLEAAAAHGCVLTNRTQFSPLSVFIAHTETHQQFHLDLFTTLNWRGFQLLAPSEVLRSRRVGDLFDVPHPIHEAGLNLLTRLFYHGYVKEEYKNEIVAAYSASPEAARHSLVDSFGPVFAARIVQQVLQGDWEGIESRTNRMRMKLASSRFVRSPVRTLHSLLADAKRLIRRFAVPPGLFVVLIGPDGCGKSTVASSLMSALATTFSVEGSRHFHWKPRLFGVRTGGSASATDPHSKPVRSTLMSFAYFSLHWTEFVLGGLFRFRPLLFRNRLVVVDRYYHDLFVDQRRYRMALPDIVIEVGYHAVQKPDLVLYLDATPGVLQDRKQEVSYEESDRQRQSYARLARRLENCFVIDATRPREEVIEEATRIVLGYLAARAERGQHHPVDFKRSIEQNTNQPRPSLQRLQAEPDHPERSRTVTTRSGNG